MKPSPEDLRRALRSLPRLRASSGFTADVLAALDARRGRPRRELRWAAAALLTAAVGVGVAREIGERRHELRRQRIEALRVESRALEHEIEALRSLAAGPEPSIYLAGGDGYEIVMGLSPWIGTPPSPRLTGDRQP